MNGNLPTGYLGKSGHTHQHLGLRSPGKNSKVPLTLSSLGDVDPAYLWKTLFGVRAQLAFIQVL